MSEATGTLDVVRGGEVKTYSWNGDVDDRKAAREAFEAMMQTGSYLGIVHDSPGRSHQVRSFDEIETVERERGSVAAQIQPALVGG